MLYAGTTIVFILSGLTMVGRATRAYVETDKRAMLYLSVGFSLVVAGAAATMISAFLTDFRGVRLLLLVKSTLFTLGFLLMMYSLLTYD